MKTILNCLSVGLFLTVAPFASATTANFTIDGSSAGSFGNSLCYSSAGTSTACNGSQFLTITAWGLTGSGNTTLQTAALGRYGPGNYGLGVCNQSEGSGCSSPNHEVDNAGSKDFVLFQFSSAINSASVVLNPVCDCYTDSTYYVGVGSVSGKTLAQLGVSVSQDGGKSQQNFALNGVNGATSILLGASILTDSTGVDYFKIGSLTWTTPTNVPEPSSLMSLGLGLGLLTWVGYRRKIATRNSQG
jgi:hypothetical protein